jgi:FdhD protein
MQKETKRVAILRIDEGRRKKAGDVVVRESPLTIVLNGKQLVTLLCSPNWLDCLAVGFLFSEGLVMSKKDIKSVEVDGKRGVAWVETKGGRMPSEDFLSKRYITTGCGKGTSFLGLPAGKMKRSESKVRLSPTAISNLMRKFQERSVTHKETGGVHSAALADAKGIIVFSEDIGRHSAVDKVIGECVLKRISMKNRVLLTSGRISSEILMKISRAGIPVVVSKSAPTDIGVSIAEKTGITLVGFARGNRMNVYSNASRIRD